MPKRSATTSEQQRHTPRARSLRARAATAGFSRWPSATWAISHGNRATTRRRGLASRKASNSSASSATSERSWKTSSVSASSRLARAGATRPRHSCVRVSSTPRRWSTRNWRSGAWKSLPRSPSRGARRSERPGSWAPSKRCARKRGTSATPEERRVESRREAPSRSSSARSSFAAALLIGREMTFEQTMAFALQTERPSSSRDSAGCRSSSRETGSPVASDGPTPRRSRRRRR